jgi:hypothetical protein
LLVKRVTAVELAEVVLAAANHMPDDRTRKALHPEDAYGELLTLLEGVVGVLGALPEDAVLPHCSQDSPWCRRHMGLPVVSQGPSFVK